MEDHTTTDLTPDQIHQIGLDEVARIGKRMDAIAAKAGYPSRAAFIQHLRTDPSYYAKTPEELLRVAARQAKTIDGLLPRYFATLLPLQTFELPFDLGTFALDIVSVAQRQNDSALQWLIEQIDAVAPG